MHKKYKNKSLWGLRTTNKVKIKYNINEKRITKIDGLKVLEDDLDCSESDVFNVPAYISVKGIPYFPTRYEIFNSNHIYYTSRTPPFFNVQIKDNGIFSERVKVKQYTIDLKKLDLYDKKRIRKPSQNSVMGESANEHAQKLIDKGSLIIKSTQKIQWHWGHLLAFSMLPTERAQQKSNLFCCTSACNGHMANIEQGVKLFVYKHKEPLSLEVTATHLDGTHLARRIRYRIHERKSGMCISEYFNALTDVFSDYADYEIVYDKLENNYKESLEFKKNA